jgi:hypothetical protein
MCHYISLVTHGIEQTHVEAVLLKNGRRATPSRIGSLQVALLAGEKQFLTNTRTCDCGTALSSADGIAKSDPKMEIDRLLARGWTKKKAERAVADRQAAEDRKQVERPDSHELWQKIVSELLAIKGSRHVGLLLHFYSGEMENESFALERRTIRCSSLTSALVELREDTLLVVTR